MLISILAPIFLFGLIVLVHEGGHFITAKLTGMKVEEFAVGFGPKVWSRQWGETVYSLRALPLGGFNKIMGMEPGRAEDPRAFNRRPIPARLLVICAGSLMNIFSAFVILTCVFLSLGIQSFPDRPVIGRVMPGSAAETAGLAPGDRILSIGGKEIGKWSEISALLEGKARRILPVIYERDGEKKEISVVPREQDGRAVVGIIPELDSRPASLGEAAGLAADRCVLITKLVFGGIWAMVTGEGEAAVSGPLGVARMAGDVAEIGMAQYFIFVALLSLNLGILNLFPIPLLDGGLFFLTLAEAVYGKPLPEKALYVIQSIGIALLLGLFLFATMKDIAAIWG